MSTMEQERQKRMYENRKKRAAGIDVPFTRGKYDRGSRAIGGNAEWQALHDFPVDTPRPIREENRYRHLASAINYERMAERYGY